MEGPHLAVHSVIQAIGILVVLRKEKLSVPALAASGTRNMNRLGRAPRARLPVTTSVTFASVAHSPVAGFLLVR